MKTRYIGSAVSGSCMTEERYIQFRSLPKTPEILSAMLYHFADTLSKKNCRPLVFISITSLIFANVCCFAAPVAVDSPTVNTQVPFYFSSSVVLLNFLLMSMCMNVTGP